jgi:hypothetical protein
MIKCIEGDIFVNFFSYFQLFDLENVFGNRDDK